MTVSRARRPCARRLTMRPSRSPPETNQRGSVLGPSWRRVLTHGVVSTAEQDGINVQIHGHCSSRRSFHTANVRPLPVSATFSARARVFGCCDRTARSGAVSSAQKFDSRSRSRRQYCPSSVGNNIAPGRLGFGTCSGGAPEIGRSTQQRERQLEGIAKAKAAAVYKGRPASIDAVQVRELKARGAAYIPAIHRFATKQSSGARVRSVSPDGK
jgi:hypothetical protein